jgi:hypothetical protein
MTPRGIVLHTVGVAGDTTIAAIRKYHVEHNGWRDVGYHRLVRKSGLVEVGRPLSAAGAHLQGANDTLGICRRAPRRPGAVRRSAHNQDVPRPAR